MSRPLTPDDSIFFNYGDAKYTAWPTSFVIVEISDIRLKTTNARIRQMYYRKQKRMDLLLSCPRRKFWMQIGSRISSTAPKMMFSARSSLKASCCNPTSLLPASHRGPRHCSIHGETAGSRHLPSLFRQDRTSTRTTLFGKSYVSLTIIKVHFLSRFDQPKTEHIVRISQLCPLLLTLWLQHS